MSPLTVGTIQGNTQFDSNLLLAAASVLSSADIANVICGLTKNFTQESLSVDLRSAKAVMLSLTQSTGGNQFDLPPAAGLVTNTTNTANTDVICDCLDCRGDPRRHSV